MQNPSSRVTLVERQAEVRVGKTLPIMRTALGEQDSVFRIEQYTITDGSDGSDTLRQATHAPMTIERAYDGTGVEDVARFVGIRATSSSRVGPSSDARTWSLAGVSDRSRYSLASAARAPEKSVHRFSSRQVMARSGALA